MIAKVETANGSGNSSGSSSTGGSGSTGSGSSSSSSVTENKKMEVEAVLANPNAQTQNRISRLLDQAEGLGKGLMKQLGSLKTAALGAEAPDADSRMAEEARDPQQSKKEKPAEQVQEAAPAKKDTPSRAEVEGLARQVGMQRAFDRGDNAWVGVEEGALAAEEVGRKPNQALDDVKAALERNAHVASNIDAAIAGVRGLLSGAMQDVSNGSHFELQPKQTDARALATVQKTGPDLPS